MELFLRGPHAREPGRLRPSGRVRHFACGIDRDELGLLKTGDHALGGRRVNAAGEAEHRLDGMDQ